MTKTLSKAIYKIHVRYMEHLDHVDVKRKLVTFNASDMSVL